MNNNNPTPEHAPEAQPAIVATTVILAEYLNGYMPVTKFAPGVLIKTTDELIAELADMADMTQTDVNRVMVTLGYMPGRNDSGSFGWMLRRIDKNHSYEPK